MDRKKLLERRAQLQRRRDAELRRCRAKYRDRINAVNRLLRAPARAQAPAPRAYRSPGSRLAASADALEGKVNGARKEGVMEVVRHTLQHNRGFFTGRTLVELINKTIASSVTAREINRALWTLCTLGEIKLVERGSGGRPHLYFKC